MDQNQTVCSGKEMAGTANETTDTALVAAALAARGQAYAPYSGFQVGAALIDERGRLFTGCNIENASYGATCCGERTAVFKAISEGARAVKKMAVVGSQPEYCVPCGICRQVLAEFAAPDFLLLAAAPDGRFVAYSLEELLPHRFTFRKI